MSGKIGWVQNPDMAQGESWNFLRGCERQSPGCDNCYAKRIHDGQRARGMHGPELINPFWHPKVTIMPDKLHRVLAWKAPRLIFVNSMSDLFHKSVPISIIQQSFAIMEQTPQHAYVVLTKRAPRLRTDAPKLLWPRNLIMGVSVEGPVWQFRLDYLITAMEQVRERQGFAPLTMCSFEPLIEDMGPKLDVRGLDWAIIGGESTDGRKQPRPMEIAWVERIADQCDKNKIPVFFKQTVDKSPTSKRWDKNESPLLRGVVRQAWPDLTRLLEPKKEEPLTLWNAL